MKKIIPYSFVIVVFLAILFPIVRFNKNGTVSEVENRSLATKPNHILNFSEYDNYFQDRFGGRNRLVTIANFIDYDIFNKEIRNNLAFKGKNNWFYYISSNDGNNLNDFYKKNLLTELELESFKNSVKKTAKWCEDNNIKYLFAIGPNKHSVYPENYIDERPEGTTRADQLISVFNELSITCVYPRDYLIEQKEKNNSPLYYETDTHWNNLGAYYAFTQIENEVKKLFPNIQFPKVDYDFEVSYSENAGDILPMLRIKKSKSTQIVAKPKNSEFSDYFEYIKNEGTGGVITKGKNENLPRAIVFRDSFFSALTPYFSTMFSSVEYNWRRMNEEDKKSILENKPDLIVFENVERYAVGIAGM